MADMKLDKVPVVNVEMLFRVPVSRVFEAFVDPDITTKFWFTRSEGRLEAGKTIRWHWEMFGVSARVKALAVEENARLLIEWGDEGSTTTVEWTFEERPDDTSLVRVQHKGFAGTGDEVVAQAIDSMGGFTLVLANAKALLEHDLQLNLIVDRFGGGH